jgi:glycosyltransferase involved in cell wall biosynthesis
MLKISVIIPLYNTAEHFLRECLDSIVLQDYSNMEVIIVYDRASDNSPAICAEYASKYPCFKVVKIEYRGPGGARNHGMEMAFGDYFMFIDSDDYWLSKTLVSDIVKLLEESHADVLSFEYQEFYRENDKPVLKGGSCLRNKVFRKDATQALKALLKRPPSCFSSVPHTKVVRSAFIRENKIRFAEKLCCEDTFFTEEIIRKAKVYDRFDMAAYAFRRTNPNSSSTQGERKYKIERDFVTVYTQMFSIIKNDIVIKGHLYKRLMDILASPYAYWMGMAIGALDFYKNNEEIRTQIKKDIEAMKQYTFIFRFSSRAYIRLIGLLCGAFGINSSLFFLRWYLYLNKRNKLSLRRRIN